MPGGVCPHPVPSVPRGITVPTLSPQCQEVSLPLPCPLSVRGNWVLGTWGLAQGGRVQGGALVSCPANWWQAWGDGGLGVPFHLEWHLPGAGRELSLLDSGQTRSRSSSSFGLRGGEDSGVVAHPLEVTSPPAAGPLGQVLRSCFSQEEGLALQLTRPQSRARHALPTLLPAAHSCPLGMVTPGESICPSRVPGWGELPQPGVRAQFKGLQKQEGQVGRPRPRGSHFRPQRPIWVALRPMHPAPPGTSLSHSADTPHAEPGPGAGLLGGRCPRALPGVFLTGEWQLPSGW